MANVITPEFRVSYPTLFKPKKNDLNNQMEYSVVALFKKGENLDKLKAAAQEACEKKWGKDKAKWPKTLRSPFRDQADRAKTNEETGKEYLPDGYEAGAFYLNLKSTTRPGVVNQAVKEITEESGDFYAGCYAYASLSCYAYDQKGNKGVAFGLQNIQKSRDGEPFGGRTKATDDFAAVAVEGGDANALFS